MDTFWRMLLRVTLIGVVMNAFLIGAVMAVDVDSDGIRGFDELEDNTNPLQSDSDGDGLGDDEELETYDTDPSKADTDDDGLSDGREIAAGSDPLLADTDGDGVPDEREIEVGALPDKKDTDGDGLHDGRELELGTDPSERDHDSDGIPDGREVELGTAPTNEDSDGDGIVDGEEIAIGSDPLSKHSDEDGLADGREVEAGSDPLDGDTDADGLDDRREVEELGSDPTSIDSDADGLTDMQEVNEATSPTAADTDGDGLTDDLEVNGSSSPTVADTDGDGLEDGREVGGGTDPAAEDTDDDDLDDSVEWNSDTDPTSTDTDEDGLEDGREKRDPRLAATNPDIDGDGLLDGRELDVGTNVTHPDTDGDGLPDGPEVNSKQRLPNADPLRKDVYVELDYMTGKRPSPTVFRKAEDAFESGPVENPDGSTGITLHVIVDDQIESNERSYATSRSGDWNDFPEYKNANFDRRGFGYHYAVVVNDVWLGDRSVGGVAPRGDLMFQNSAYYTDWTGSTFMHELGHTLGLRYHDGVDSQNYSYKEYPSVMNYNAPYTVYSYSEGGSSPGDQDDWKRIMERMHMYINTSRFDADACTSGELLDDAC